MWSLWAQPLLNFPPKTTNMMPLPLSCWWTFTPLSCWWTFTTICYYCCSLQILSDTISRFEMIRRNDMARLGVFVEQTVSRSSCQRTDSSIYWLYPTLLIPYAWLRFIVMRDNTLTGKQIDNKPVQVYKKTFVLLIPQCWIMRTFFLCWRCFHTRTLASLFIGQG